MAEQVNLRTPLSPVRQHWMPTEQAIEQYLAYEERYGRGHALLACHAAFPLIVTPELVNLIGLNFLSDQAIDWVAEADFLLAFCHPIDTSEGLYQIDPGLREVMLTDLQESDYGMKRLYELADFLLAYEERYGERQRQPYNTCVHQWIAWSYLSPQKLVDDLKAVLLTEGIQSIGSIQLPAHQIHVATMIEVLSDAFEMGPPVLEQKYHDLLKRAQVVIYYWYRGADLLNSFPYSGQSIEVSSEPKSNELLVNVINRHHQLAVEPDVNIDNEWQDIPPPPQPSPSPSIAEFIGREGELASYAEKLAHLNVAIITGMAGVGKTALAAKLAQQSTPLSHIFWHTFRENEDMLVLIWKLAGFLYFHGQRGLWYQIQSERSQQPSEQIINRWLNYLLESLRGYGYLLCFDNFHYAQDVLLVEEFITNLYNACGRKELSIIITSREIPAFVQRSDLNSLVGLSFEDTRYLIETHNLVLSDETLATLHTQLEGNPQLLLLAISALQRISNPARLVESLSDSQEIESYLINEVDMLLTQDEQIIMGAVALFLGHPVTVDDVEAILDDEVDTIVRKALRSLCNRFLLIRSEENDGQLMYHQHRIVREFYYGMLSLGQRKKMHHLAADLYKTEKADIMNALQHYHLAGKYDKVVELATIETQQLINQGHAQALLEIFEKLPNSISDPQQRAAIDIAKGDIYIQLSKLELARNSLKRALSQIDQLSPSPNVSDLQIRAYKSLAGIVKLNDPREALLLLDRALLIAASNNHTQKVAELRIQRGKLKATLGEYQEAIDDITENLTILGSESASIRLEAYAALGTIYNYQGDMNMGRQYLQEAIVLAESLHDQFSIMRIRYNFALAEYYSGKWDQAIIQLHKVIRLAEMLGNKYQIASTLLNLGVIYLHLGDDQHAQHSLAESLRLSREYNSSTVTINALSSLAELRLYSGDIHIAAQLLIEATSLAFQINDKNLLSEILRNRAQLELATNSLEAALKAIEQSLKIANEFHMVLEEGMSLRVLADVRLAMGTQLNEVFPIYEQSLNFLQESHYEAARTKFHWGQALLASEPAQGRILLAAARETFLQLGAKRYLWKVETLLASA